MSLSLIVVTICFAATTQYVSEITYAVRSISDHSSVNTNLEVRPISTMTKAPWKLNAFWLNMFSSHAQIATKIGEFWEDQGDQVGLETAWEVLGPSFAARLFGISM